MSGSGVSGTVYGGPPGEMGSNGAVLEWIDRLWLLDFDTRLGARGRFFEELVKLQRSTLGLRNYLGVEFLAPLEGQYQTDLNAHGTGLFARHRAHPPCGVGWERSVIRSRI